MLEDEETKLIDTQSEEDLMIRMSSNANRKKEFKNTIYENLTGAKMVDVKVVYADGLSKYLNNKREKMGTIYLNISSGKLYEAWEEAF